MRKLLLIASMFLGVVGQAISQGSSDKVYSPDKQLEVSCDIQRAVYSVKYKGAVILKESRLGIVREDEDFSENLKLVRTSGQVPVRDSYRMVNAKKSEIRYNANERTWETVTATGKKMNVVFRVSNDGVAFRYVFPEKSGEIKKITAERTSFHFNSDTKAWLQPKTEAQTGFEHTNPSYEAYYEMDIPVGKSSPVPNGWVYPALFKTPETWVVITEADLGDHYCGTALQQHSPDGEYKINFPQAPEVFTDGVPTLNPESSLPWKTPWRILAIGDLKTVMESTLGTDLAEPEVQMNSSFIKPGKASWSWIIKKDDSTVYKV